MTPLDDIVDDGDFDGDCSCDFSPIQSDPEGDLYYLRRCAICRAVIHSLHCPHDGVQSRCSCGARLPSRRYVTR